MRKHILLLAALLTFCGGAYAQSSAKDRLSEIEGMEVTGKKIRSRSADNPTTFSIISRYGYGWHMMDGDAFRGKFGPSRELFVNLFSVGIRPTGWLSFDAGINFKNDLFCALPGKEFSFGETVKVGDNTTLSSLESRISVNSFTLPIALNLHSDYVGLRAGVEFFRPNRKLALKSSYSVGDTDYTARTRGASPMKNGYNLFATLLVADTAGVYFKYYPKYEVTGDNFSFSYCTLGVLFTFE